MVVATDGVEVDETPPVDEAPVDFTGGAHAGAPKNPAPEVSRAILLGLAMVTALAALAGWLGVRAYQAHHWQTERSQYLEVAKAGATNLTTIDWQHADRDVQRILDGATGQFYDDFAKRSQPFVDVVNKTKSTTTGTVTEAGLESQAADNAKVLVALTVTTSNDVAPQPDSRGWRLRITVQRVGDQAKVSNVEFVK